MGDEAGRIEPDADPLRLSPARIAGFVAYVAYFAFSMTFVQPAWRNVPLGLAISLTMSATAKATMKGKSRRFWAVFALAGWPLLIAFHPDLPTKPLDMLVLNAVLDIRGRPIGFERPIVDVRDGPPDPSGHIVSAWLCAHAALSVAVAWTIACGDHILNNRRRSRDRVGSRQDSPDNGFGAQT